MSEENKVVYKKAKSIVLPKIDLDFDVEYMLRLDSNLKYETRADKDGKEHTIASFQATNLETSEVGVILCPELLQASLESAYPEGCKDKLLSIEKNRVKGKRYFSFQVYELEQV